MRRYRARQRGEPIPRQRPGPKASKVEESHDKVPARQTITPNNFCRRRSALSEGQKIQMQGEILADILQELCELDPDRFLPILTNLLRQQGFEELAWRTGKLRKKE